MIRQHMPHMENTMKIKNGFTMVEVVVALAILGVALLAITQGFVTVSKALAQSKVKNQVLQFANAELEYYQKLARVPNYNLDGTVPSNPLPNGYVNLMQPDTGVVPTMYPKNLLGGAATSSDQERFQLFRKVVISTINAGKSDEYKEVTVTLSDSINPARFSPISVNTIIRKPDPSSLDSRRTVGKAFVIGTAIDKDTKAPIPGINITLKTLDKDITIQYDSTTGNDGKYSFPSINILSGMKFILSSSPYYMWPEEKEVTISEGNNDLDKFEIQRVYVATVTANVINNQDESPIQDAQVDLSVPDGSLPPLPASSNMTNCSFYSKNTTCDGKSVFFIPIPVKNSNTYVGYCLTRISKPGYYDVAPNIPVDLDKNNEKIANIEMVHIDYGRLSVHIKSQDGSNLNLSWAGVYDNGNESNQMLMNGGVSLVENTNLSGNVSFAKVPVNYPSGASVTTRDVRVKVIRVGYKRKEQVITIQKDMPTNATIELEPHSMNFIVIPAPSNGKITTGKSSLTTIKTRIEYKGHCSAPLDPDDYASALTALGATSMTRQWTWDIASTLYGKLSAISGAVYDVQNDDHFTSTRDDRIGFTSSLTNTGDTDLTTTASMRFRYNSSAPNSMEMGKVFGPNSTYIVPPISNTTTISVIDTLAVPTFNISISGPDKIPPQVSTNYTANPSYSNGTPSDYVYSWCASGSYKEISNTSWKTCTLKAKNAPGETITLSVNVMSDSLGLNKTVNKTITIEIPAVSISVSPTSADLAIISGKQIFTASSAGGVSPFSYNWQLVDTSGNSIGMGDPTHGSISSNSDSSTQYSAPANPVSVILRATVTDNIGSTTSTDVTINVAPSGYGG